ncbi:MAG: sterol desaturase family protein [Bdellovibrionales bacterium]|nr:sterol desaturase family protein [Bdellovibrionales bacterium]
MNQLILFVIFSGLTLVGLLNEESRKATLGRSHTEWILDLAGLFIQGILIPAFPFLMVPLLTYLVPDYQGRMDVSPIIQFLVSFVLVDYLYYWNHRLLHKNQSWVLHKLHHSSRHLDIFATSRNSFITSFLMVYVWFQVAAMYLLYDSSAFMLGLAFTFGLDLWRHSGVNLPHQSNQYLKFILILPGQHVLHHSLSGRNKNFGANFSWWDMIHGTYSPLEVPNRNLEKMPQGKILNQVFMPWKDTK